MKPDPSLRTIIRWKIDRLKDGLPPRVVDLFAGCGGLSLGTLLAGCEQVGAVELDPVAARSHALNFTAGTSPEVSRAHGIPRDITKTNPLRFVRDVRPDATDPRREVDLLVGGPPCQAFARVGRAKLREIDEHPEAFLHDERSGLYRHYLKFVEHLAPVAVIVENVPDVLNYGGLNIFETIACALEEAGYKCRYGLLNAAHYGVPQMRTRCFLVGVHRLAEIEPRLPSPTHRHDLPVGYRGTRDVALRHMDLFNRSHYVEPPAPPESLPHAVTAREAIGDLPRILSHLKGDAKKAPQRLDKAIKVADLNATCGYAHLMRTWPEFESDGYVYDHVIRFLPRDYKLFKEMNSGDQYPEAYALATRMFHQAVTRMEAERGSPLPRNSKRYKELFVSYVPPYDPTKFPNKWRKMEADEPSRTLMAHIGKDTYSHIHYDSLQARTISVREAARLQSFPDGFRFCGTMNPAFRQIGNAVPPLLAHAVAARVLADLSDRKSLRVGEPLVRRWPSAEARREPVSSSR